ncbi:MAG: ATP-binding protein [Desulforhopalus sp.]
MMLTYLGQVTGKVEVLDLSEVCKKMRPLLNDTLPEGVRLQTRLQSPGPIVKANGDHVRQILTNLIANAGEAAGNGSGSVLLAVSEVQPTDIPASHRFPITWQPGEIPYGCLEIRDEGCGIPDKDIEEIFSPFFSTKFTGRGLGLSAVLGLVKAYNGAVTAESTPGQGSVFCIYLPISAELVPQPHKSIETQQYQPAGTVLLVDDDPVVLEISKAMLSTLGFTVLTAMDGFDAVEIFQQYRDEIRLVISDVAMPRMDGWATLLILRKIDPNIPVILASGYSEDLIMQGAHPEHPQAFLAKPYDLSALQDAICRSLHQSGPA